MKRKWKNNSDFYLLFILSMNRLHTARDIIYFRKKISELNILVRRLRTSRDCNADYENYKEIERRIERFKWLLS
nr:MAG TPA: hypothetical protein [Caudoviricetes sp.]